MDHRRAAAGLALFRPLFGSTRPVTHVVKELKAGDEELASSPLGTSIMKGGGGGREGKTDVFTKAEFREWEARQVNAQTIE
jgi:hypothetical protein